eukprot:TRINITY_DN4685_c0_g1_i5.p1 TRINITY_DN4685_c0_g1~~TRINITY_DN4685_c0_g1_i5.p1  ORF type:complete len:275 (-),score=49.45 TRINITY_DN4685_c0_g1_i5:787-1611(-)
MVMPPVDQSRRGDTTKASASNLFTLDFSHTTSSKQFASTFRYPTCTCLSWFRKKFYFLSKVEIKAKKTPKSLNEHFSYIAEFAGNGHLGCLKYTHENGCEWKKKTFESAAQYDQLHCLKYAHENGCEWDSRTMQIAYDKKEKILYCILGEKHPDLVRSLLQSGVQEGVDLCRMAAELEDLESLQLLFRSEYKYDLDCDGAALRGSLDCLKFLHENSVKCDKETFESATANGHLKCLKYLHENKREQNGYKLVPVTIKVVRSLESLKYLRENGCG